MKYSTILEIASEENLSTKSQKTKAMMRERMYGKFPLQQNRHCLITAAVRLVKYWKGNSVFMQCIQEITRRIG
jgi:hypothetical protein